MSTPRRTPEDLPPRMQHSESQYLQPQLTANYLQPQLTANHPQQAHAAARQTIWGQVLDAGHKSSTSPGADAGARGPDTFVQMEEPAERMTKAFTPHGLLSAGLHDKEERSAKRQEELARESGASLLSVQNKPPPPQTGLLGAITAHERERKREGGFGAALTEREREKRAAEERQRRLDDLTRQQLELAQGGASAYGGMGMGMPQGFMNPMMTGMPMNPMMQMGNPMMQMGGMGMNPMMGGGAFNPHVFAAQQAAQAYQQAMMAFSVAGSQAGDGGGGGAADQARAVSPAPTGMGMMPGYDPRMTMMAMNPMMTGGMPGWGMQGGMGMQGMQGGMGMQGMGMPMGGMMGPQMTGMSQFGAAGLQPPQADFGGARVSAPGSGPSSPGPAAGGEERN
jgi:CCR4-NOT transcriptional complex subunit CAF120